MSTVITLNTKEELEIYMHPQRQKLLRLLTLSQHPCTPKELSDKMGISPSSVQHHIKKLISLGLVVLDHTQVIRGITARYYTVLRDVEITIGYGRGDGLDGDRDIFVRNLLSEVTISALARARDSAYPNGPLVAEILTGLIYLPRDKMKELLTQIQTFVEENKQQTPESLPWEYALMVYEVEGDK